MCSWSASSHIPMFPNKQMFQLLTVAILNSLVRENILCQKLLGRLVGEHLQWSLDNADFPHVNAKIAFTQGDKRSSPRYVCECWKSPNIKLRYIRVNRKSYLLCMARLRVIPMLDNSRTLVPNFRLLVYFRSQCIEDRGFSTHVK